MVHVHNLTQVGSLAQTEPACVHPALHYSHFLNQGKFYWKLDPYGIHTMTSLPFPLLLILHSYLRALQWQYRLGGRREDFTPPGH